ARDAAAADDNNGEYWKTPLAWAEIETNPVFVPWHQHRRVKMFHYTPEKYLKLTAATNIKMKPAPESSAPVKKAEKSAEVAGNTWKLEQDMTENASPQTDTPKPAPTPDPTEPPPPAPAPTPPTAAPVQA